VSGRRSPVAGSANRAVVMGALLLGAAAGGGCTVGGGNGSAQGPIFDLAHGCGSNGADYGSADAPRLYSLSPQFFAGEPIDDIGPAPESNRLVMRMQRTGNGIEVNDTLYFDAENAFEVARCVRGRTVGGVPDWSTEPGWCTQPGAPVTSDGGADAEAGTADAGAMADAGTADAGGDGGAPLVRARIHLGTEEFIRSSLVLLLTCHTANVVGVAVDGWIDFLDFGSAAQSNLSPELRTPIAPDFKVEFGDRLRANFHVVLGDQRVVTAIKDMDQIPSPLFGGYLDGFFDFNLERGRGAQPFP
jgi:hypothetical protein